MQNDASEEKPKRHYEGMLTNKLSTEPYKGVRDFYPADQFIQNHIFEVMRKVSESFGYEEYNASPLEPTELYLSKTSEEIVNEQTYTFEDRGGRSVTLRPEMTPTVARMVAAKRRELGFPLRLYSIPNVFRYERPQRGRLREHYQLNCDIFGVADMFAEIEIILVAHTIMKAFGARDEDFAIKINSRKLLEAIYDIFALSPEERKSVSHITDRKDKMPREKFQEQLKPFLKTDANVESYIAMLEAQSLKDLPQEIQDDARAKELYNVIDYAKSRGALNATFSMSIVRGFDYYTGVVFEVFDTHPENNRSLFGGGRYDNLLEMFGSETVPTVGFGMGDVTIRDFLETHELLPPYFSSTDLYIGITDKQYEVDAHTLAMHLRFYGVNVAIDFSGRKIGDQIKVADKKKIPFFIAIGEDESKSQKYKLKNLVTGVEKEVTEDQIPVLIHDDEE